MDKLRFYELQKLTTQTLKDYKEFHGAAPENVSKMLASAILEEQKELIDTLEIWIDKGLSMTNGELIMANVNLGAVVEFWLRLFFCLHYNDLNKIVEPENATFDDLIKLSANTLFDEKTVDIYNWVITVHHKQNAIHSFNYIDIGTPQDFLEDIEKLYSFVEIFITRTPRLEDYI